MLQRILTAPSCCSALWPFLGFWGPIPPNSMSYCDFHLCFHFHPLRATNFNLDVLGTVHLASNNPKHHSVTGFVSGEDNREKNHGHIILKYLSQFPFLTLWCYYVNTCWLCMWRVTVIMTLQYHCLVDVELNSMVHTWISFSCHQQNFILLGRTASWTLFCLIFYVSIRPYFIFWFNTVCCVVCNQFILLKYISISFIIHPQFPSYILGE